MKIAIPTKGRADVLGDKAPRLFPDATLCIGADEVEGYSRRSRTSRRTKPGGGDWI